MTYQFLCYTMIFWMQIYGLADVLSDRSVDRFCGWVTFSLATAILFSADWLVKLAEHS